jgi:hypothetical protein
MGYRPEGTAASRYARTASGLRPLASPGFRGYLTTVTQYEHDITNAESRSATDAAPGLFAPDLLLATQHAVARLPESPCRRLVAAVLERALLDAVGPTSKQPDREDALGWIQSNDEEPFSFRWVAFQLGMDPEWLRSRIRRVQQAARPSAPDVAPALAAIDGEDGDQRAA